MVAAQAKLMASQYGPEAAEFALGFIPGYDLYSAATTSNATRWDYAAAIAGIIPGVGKGVGFGVKAAGKMDDVARAVKGKGTAAKGSGDAIQVTKSGVALPSGAKHQILEGYVQNPAATAK